MKSLLNAIKQTLRSAGDALRAAWQLLRQKAAALWLAARTELAGRRSAIRTTAAGLWQRHRSRLAWSALTALIAVALTLTTLYLSGREAVVRRWFEALQSGRLILPAGVSLQLTRATRPVARTNARRPRLQPVAA